MCEGVGEYRVGLSAAVKRKPGLLSATTRLRRAPSQSRESSENRRHQRRVTIPKSPSRLQLADLEAVGIVILSLPRNIMTHLESLLQRGPPDGDHLAGLEELRRIVLLDGIPANHDGMV